MKDPIVILHGWGSTMSGRRYDEIKEIFEKNGFTVFAPDLPGFGKNTLKKEELFFDDYVDFVKNFINKNKFKKVSLLGHSFGGRISIAFTAKYPELVSKLILVGASGISHPLPSIKKKIVFIFSKITKPIFSIFPFTLFYKYFRKIVYYAIGETDYINAKSLTKTFKNVYKVSIENDLQKISRPTIILWGENDTITPLADGELMHKKIAKSKLVIIKHATHKLPYENPKIFAQEVLAFLN